ncbi:hypothetical protein F0562_028839 [Nyssa sinensis]|uniref:KIB1-4 beta-propeller domain-containing protein n=1 Tax=Nyssa sinensis TaxID=561372 RepID=A0A5J5B5D9_9ASTE|nr:hypothetical protein F0562_028839 [Nyssa sinensis]
MQNFSFGGVTKSWRAAPRKCNPVGKSPWLQLSDTNDGNCATQPHISNISFFLSDDFGYCNFGDHVKRPWRLWHIIPPWDTNVPLKYATLSTSPADPKGYIEMVLTGTCRPAFVFHRIGGTKPYPNYLGPGWIKQGGENAWIKQDCTLVDPYASNQQRMQFTNAVGYKGKLYALSLQGTLAVIEDIDSHPRIAAMSTSRAIPSLSSRHFREYLFESNGEILLVFLISRKTINIVDDVEVFGLHIPRLSWVKMESLGDRTLFAGVDCCMLVTASKVGCRRNCICFKRHAVDGWWVFDMKGGSISPGWSSTDSMTKSPLLELGRPRLLLLILASHSELKHLFASSVRPQMAPKAKNGRPNMGTTTTTTTTTITRRWSNLPQQLIKLIACRQSTLMQNLSFGGVTKSGRAAPRKCNTVGKSP